MLQTFRKLKLNKSFHSENGLTMIELLTTIAVLGIVAAIASPIIISMIQQAQVDAYKGELSYVSDSTYKMVVGTFGEPGKAAGNITSDGSIVNMQSLGPRLDPATGVSQGGSMLGYWYDISDMALPFDLTNPDALVLWDNSRVVRVVLYSDNSQTPLASSDEVIVDACLTAWVGNTNIVIPSLKSSQVLENQNTAPCGLIPGPIEAPGAPGAPQSLEPTGSGATSDLDVALISPPDNLGGDSSDISIASYRVTCTDSGNTGSIIATNATSTMTLTGFTRGLDYTCTAAVSTNAYPGYGDESVASATIRIPEEPGAPTGLSSTTALSSNPKDALSWTTPTDDGCNEPGVDDGNNCGTAFTLTNYIIEYIQKPDGTDPLTQGDTEFAGASQLEMANANTNYPLSDANINAYNLANSTTLQTLADGSTYCIRVQAKNSADLTGAWSTPICEKTATEPATVSDAAGQDGVNQVTITFSVPYNGGLAITKYEIWYDINNTYDGGGTSYTGPDGSNTPLGRSIVVCNDNTSPNYSAVICGKAQGETITVTIDTLPDSTSYFVKIFSENAMGMSAWSDNGDAVVDVAVSTYAPAEAPTTTDASIDTSGNATVTWN